MMGRGAAGRFDHTEGKNSGIHCSAMVVKDKLAARLGDSGARALRNSQPIDASPVSCAPYLLTTTSDDNRQAYGFPIMYCDHLPHCC